jgi:hypothetical protein
MRVNAAGAQKAGGGSIPVSTAVRSRWSARVLLQSRLDAVALVDGDVDGFGSPLGLGMPDARAVA